MAHISTIDIAWCVRDERAVAQADMSGLPHNEHRPEGSGARVQYY
jgi:hypothetical protein